MKYVFLAGLVAASMAVRGQNSFTMHSVDLGIDQTVSMTPDPMSEDDPRDLAEAYGQFYGYLKVLGGSGNAGDYRLELHFPTKVTSWHWSQNGEQDANDSLMARLVYNTDPKSYGHTVDAYAKDFTITVTRYDGVVKGGVVEGNFSGTLEGYLAWNHQTIRIPVKGSFRTTRTGHGAECRKLRASERVVLEKARDVLRMRVAEPLQAAGWSVDMESTEKGEVANNPRPFRPLMLCAPWFGFKLKLDEHSPLGQELRDSAAYYAHQGSSKDIGVLKAAMRNMSRIQKMMAVDIRVWDNSPYIREPWILTSRDRFSVRTVPGAGYACQVVRAPKSDLDLPDEATDVYIGNWAGADMHATGSYVLYPFRHKETGPWLENLRFEIDAPKEVADAIIAKVDWNAVGAALTR